MIDNVVLYNFHDDFVSCNSFRDHFIRIYIKLNGRGKPTCRKLIDYFFTEEQRHKGKLIIFIYIVDRNFSIKPTRYLALSLQRAQITPSNIE